MSAKSWVTSANELGDFPLANLPYGSFEGESRPRRLGVRIGDEVVDLRALVECGLLGGLDGRVSQALTQPTLNAFLALGPEAWRLTRARLTQLLRADCPELRDHPKRGACLVPAWGLSMRLPCDIGDYTDFYASVHHATNVGTMFRPTNPLLPNWKHLPVGYHGRSSSLCASPTQVRRPCGQTSATDEGPPVFGPTKLLDYELEVGAIIGTGNPIGTRVTPSDAWRRIFGLVLVNDWSARDVQKWEYQPLGPFTAKNFVTTVSPWVVTMEALRPYCEPVVARPGGDPMPLPHLICPNDVAIPIQLEVTIASEKMRQARQTPHLLSRGNFRDMYWSFAQMLAHHTSTGCPMQPGDLIASGTVSGPAKDSRGCLLELTWRGTEPIDLPDGTQRRFLQDGDEVGMSGRLERAGLPRLGFGDCTGTVLPAHPAD